MTTKHPEHPRKDEKHPEPPRKDEKHLEHPHKDESRLPEKERHQRIELKRAGGDETVVTHGTQSYPIPRDGIADLPPHVAEHVIRQGGARMVDPPPVPVEGTMQIRHVSDPDTTLSYGDETYKAARGGIITIPLAIFPEVEPHGFEPVVIDEPHHVV